MARRADYALGKAIRDGQHDGRIATQGADKGEARKLGSKLLDENSKKPTPSSLVPNAQERTDLYKIADNATPGDVERALQEERGRGDAANLSRANLSRATEQVPVTATTSNTND